jgi:endonuclease YncB( thermonuclease family)
MIPTCASPLVEQRLQKGRGPEKGKQHKGQGAGQAGRSHENLAQARKLFDRQIKSKTNPDRKCPRKYTMVYNCEELVGAGLAWHYKKYSSDQKLADLGAQARKGRVGLWSDQGAVAPWEYRRRNR